MVDIREYNDRGGRSPFREWYDGLNFLLGCGTKQRQQNDIKLALERWEDYKQRKKQQKEKKRSEYGFDARF